MLGRVSSSSTGSSPHSDGDEETPVTHDGTAADVLLTLVDTDAAIDRAEYRREVLPARDRLASASAVLTAWEQRRGELRDGCAAAEAAIAESESIGATCDAEQAALTAKLRTVIAPREAEALQNELAQVAQRRSDADDAGLAALDRHGELDAALSELVAAEADLRAECSAADEELRSAEAEIDAEMDVLQQRRLATRGELADNVLARYDRLRAQLGVAAARLVGSRCDGCHLDMSQAELDEVRHAPADDFPDCPQCGRLLVR